MSFAADEATRSAGQLQASALMTRLEQVSSAARNILFDMQQHIWGPLPGRTLSIGTLWGPLPGRSSRLTPVMSVTEGHDGVPCQ